MRPLSSSSQTSRFPAYVTSSEFTLEFKDGQPFKTTKKWLKSLVFLGNYVLASFFLDTIRRCHFAPWIFSIKDTSSVYNTAGSQEKYLAGIVKSLKIWLIPSYSLSKSPAISTVVCESRICVHK